MPDILSDSLNKIKTYESIGKTTCVVANTKLVRNVLLTLKKSGYVREIEEAREGKFTKLKVLLANKINDIGAIRPRHAVTIDAYQKYETRYVPSKDFGILIVSTPQGIMSNKEAKEKSFGGRLLAYVY